MEENTKVRVVIGLICGVICLVIGLAVTYGMTLMFETPWSFMFTLGIVGLVAFLSGFYSIFFSLKYAPIDKLNAE